jgi:hypothetical protein
MTGLMHCNTIGESLGHGTNRETASRGGLFEIRSHVSIRQLRSGSCDEALALAEKFNWTAIQAAAKQK